MELPQVLPNSTNFLGVALVVNRNRDGPRFVFHYPSQIPSPSDSAQREFAADQDDDVFGDRLGNISAVGSASEFLPMSGEFARWNHDEHLVVDNGTQLVPWEYVAGHPTKSLEGILTPPRAFHKKRFQISLDSVSYVSYPIHVPTSGFWGKKKNRKGKATKGNGPSENLASEDALQRDNAEAEDKEDKVSSMTMFNLVFIFCPKNHESNELLDIMYTHVVREVNKVYKYCQESADFVWQECKRILQLKDQARECRTRMSVLWQEILGASSLAASMRDVYEAVCRNRIAVLELNLGKGSVGHSVQIPMPFYVSDVQPQAVEAARSLWITTANSVSGYDALGGLAAFDKCFALLLTDDNDKKIVADLQARGDKAATAMIELVKAAKPTLSFHQIAQLPDTMLTIQQVRAYAQHFIYWRRAMAVPPIHARDMYILSPNCDLSSLPQAAANFAHAFPFAPPLPDLLAGLSAAPRPYKSFCPSKSLRPAYVRILAWLIRGGWACQLCTFAYVVVWPEIQYEVEHDLESEDLARIKQKQQQLQQAGKAGQDQDRQMTGAPNADQQPPSKQQSIKSQEADEDTDDELLSVVSDDVASARSSSAQGPSRDIEQRARPSAAEHAAERARRQRIAEKAAHTLAERATAHARKPVPARTEHPSVNGASHLADILPHIILDASKPTGRESLYLSAIERHLRARRTPPPPASKKDANKASTGSTSAGASGMRTGELDAIAEWNGRVGDMWPIFWKYFNGRSALERIALLEEMKRKDVWNLLSAMSEYLLCVRHW